MKSFPKPLNEVEENKTLLLCADGDLDARACLIEHNLRLVVHIAKRYSNVERELDDLISIGTIGLIKAIDSYKGGKKIRLATYASKCIENELLMFLRNNRKQSKKVYLSEPIGSDKEGNEISLLDIVEAQEEDLATTLDLKDDIKKLYQFVEASLNGREKEIILLRYGLYGRKEVTQRELAENFGISRSYVSRIEKRALERLRSEFEKISK